VSANPLSYTFHPSIPLNFNVALGKGDGEGKIKKTSGVGGHKVVNL